MCVIAIKYFKDVGFVGVKNRDRNYRPTIKIKQSNRKQIERLYIWDVVTKYTEGINEYGVSVISASVNGKKDEKEGFLDSGHSGRPRSGDPDFFSPDGKSIRFSLLEKTVEDALKFLIKRELKGNTFIFDKEHCILLEATLDDKEKYIYKARNIKKDEIAVRTNLGVDIKSGYNPNSEDENERLAYKSSISRMNRSLKDLKKVKDPYKMLDAVSDRSNPNPQMNPLRIEKTFGKTILRTTGQLMIIPNDMTLYYRPIWCNMDFNFDKLDSVKSKTYFQILSARKIFESFDNVLIDGYSRLDENILKF